MATPPKRPASCSRRGKSTPWAFPSCWWISAARADPPEAYRHPRHARSRGCRRRRPVRAGAPAAFRARSLWPEHGLRRHPPRRPRAPRRPRRRDSRIRLRHHARHHPQPVRRHGRARRFRPPSCWCSGAGASSASTASPTIPSTTPQSLKCPALFLHGADDPRATLAEGRRVFDAVPGPKRFVAFENVGHDSYAARHPEPWRAAVRDFLAPLLPPLRGIGPRLFHGVENVRRGDRRQRNEPGRPSYAATRAENPTSLFLSGP